MAKTLYSFKSMRLTRVSVNGQYIGDFNCSHALAIDLYDQFQEDYSVPTVKLPIEEPDWDQFIPDNAMTHEVWAYQQQAV